MNKKIQKPKTIVCCGSSRFCQEMAVVCWLLERDEGAIAMGLHLLPWWYPNICDDHLAEHENVADNMDELHLHKIDKADEIFVVNINGYYGDSTSRELAYARQKGLPVRWFTSDDIGRKVLELKTAGLEMARSVTTDNELERSLPFAK